MAKLQEVHVGVQPLERFAPILGEARMREVLETAAATRARLAKRVVWNINSTAVGGGVAEMLQSLVGYTRSVGIDSRWLVIEGSPEFFRITKRIHHALHGSKGDGSELDERARSVYEQQLADNAIALRSFVRAGDIVILHDPQTAGLAPSLLERGACVVWRSHVGADSPNEETLAGWRFLEPYIENATRYVFSREAYVTDLCERDRVMIIHPSIDAFSPKNQSLPDPIVRSILVHTGILEGPAQPEAGQGFVRDDGTPGRVERRADVTRLGRPPAADTPLVVQVSRWDPLKDMAGVMEGFARFCHERCPVAAELVLAGPDVREVADDPEGESVFREVEDAWRQLPEGIRDRVHLVSLPVADVQENAAIVNALQRHASVVVQKSLQEGFGLTVTEAMWKARPMLASAVGGIRDQIEDGRSGLLLEDPTDLDAFAKRLCDLLCNPEQMNAFGLRARERVERDFLGPAHLLKYAELIERLDQA